MILFRRHQAPVYHYALRMGLGAAGAADVAQEVFATLMEVAGRFDSTRGSFRGWILGIARKFVVRQLEGGGRLVLGADAGEAGASASAVDALSRRVARDRVEDVREAIAALGEAHREVVILCDLLGFSYEETAEAVGCPVGTVRSRLHRAHERLVALLGETPASGEHPGSVMCAKEEAS